MHELVEAPPSRYFLKGNKLTVKHVKRNILLKLQNNRKNYRSEMSLQTIAPEKTITPLKKNHLHLCQEFSASKDCYGANASRLSSEIDVYSHSASQVKRMDEYLDAVFRKVEQDTEKVMKAITASKELRKQQKQKSYQSPHFTYVKRYKLNSMKLRIRRQRNQLVPNPQQSHEQNLNMLLDKIQKTEDFRSRSQSRLSSENFHRNPYNPYNPQNPQKYQSGIANRHAHSIRKYSHLHA